MRVLVADTLPETFAAAVADAGWDITERPGSTEADLADHIEGHDALVVRSTPVSAATIDVSDRLSLIVRAGAGTNTIDVAAASGRAITVSNVPGRNSIAVAELTLALLLSIDRNVPDNVASLRAGRWEKKRFGRAAGLHGRTFGLIGLGSIGCEVASRVAALGMHLVATRRRHPTGAVDQLVDELRIRLVDSPAEVAALADVVSLHLPLNDETRGMVDTRFLAHMRPNSILLNTSRGELIADEAELVAAIEEKDLRVGLDVYHDEPAGGSGSFSSHLAAHPAVYGTHHIGASTSQAQEAVAMGVFEILKMHSAGMAMHAVNLLDTTGNARLVVRHANRVGVLSGVLSHLRKAGLNVENMENHIFAGERGAVARLDVSAIPPADVQAAIRDLPEVIHLAVSGA